MRTPKETLSDLDKIEARAEAAPGRPWYIIANGFGDGDLHVLSAQYEDAVLMSIGGDIPDEHRKAAARFVSGARDDVHDLVALVRHLVAERAERAGAERGAAGAALCAAMPSVVGDADRTPADLVAQIIVDRGNLRGAMAAQDERERQAGDRCGVSAVVHGCDWPEAVADALVDARRQRDEAIAAEVAVRRQLAGVEARYADALTVLRWSGTDVTDFNGTPEIHTSCGMSRGVPAIAAFERIRPDLEAQQ